MPIKVTDLQSEDAPTDDDLLIIRDNLTQTTRKITRAKFFENPPINDGGITEDMLGDGSVTKRSLAADARYTARIDVEPSPGTLTPDITNYDMFIVTTLNSNMTVAAPVGTPFNGQPILFRFKDNGTSRTITWNAAYRGIGITLPTTTVAGKTYYIAARYNAEALKWDVLSIGRES